MLFCTKCARLLDDGAEKCPHCGNDLRSNADLLNESHFDLPAMPSVETAPLVAYAEVSAPVYEEPSMPVYPSAPVVATPAPIPVEQSAPATNDAPVAESASGDSLDGELSRLNSILTARKTTPAAAPSSGQSLSYTAAPSYTAPSPAASSAPRPGTDFRAYGTPAGMGAPAAAAYAPPRMGYEDSVGTGTMVGLLLLALIAPLFGLIAGASMRSNASPARKAFGKAVVITSAIQFVLSGTLMLIVIFVSSL